MQAFHRSVFELFSSLGFIQEGTKLALFLDREETKTKSSSFQKKKKRNQSSRGFLIKVYLAFICVLILSNTVFP